MQHACIAAKVGHVSSLDCHLSLCVMKVKTKRRTLKFSLLTGRMPPGFTFRVLLDPTYVPNLSSPFAPTACKQTYIKTLSIQLDWSEMNLLDFITHQGFTTPCALLDFCSSSGSLLLHLLNIVFATLCPDSQLHWNQ